MHKFIHLISTSSCLSTVIVMKSLYSRLKQLKSMKGRPRLSYSFPGHSQALGSANRLRSTLLNRIKVDPVVRRDGRVMEVAGKSRKICSFLQLNTIRTPKYAITVKSALKYTVITSILRRVASRF